MHHLLCVSVCCDITDVNTAITGFCLFVLVPLIYAHVNKVIAKRGGGGYRLPSVTCFRCHVSGVLAPHVYTLMLLHGSSPHVFQ